MGAVEDGIGVNGNLTFSLGYEVDGVEELRQRKLWNFLYIIVLSNEQYMCLFISFIR